MMSALIRFLENLQLALEQMGGWAILAFAGIFVAVQLMMLPGAPLAMAAGFFFGFGKGWLALTLGCMLGATLNFWIARRLARQWVQRKFGGNPKFRVIDRVVEREGWKIVALLRCVPIPFGLANYAYGLSSVRYVHYIVASFFGILPANSLLVWIGATSQGELVNVLVLRHITKIARTAVARSGEAQL